MNYVKLNINEWATQIGFTTDLIKQIMKNVLKQNGLDEDLVNSTEVICCENNPLLALCHFQFSGTKTIHHPLFTNRFMTGDSKKISLILTSVVSSNLMNNCILDTQEQEEVESTDQEQQLLAELGKMLGVVRITNTAGFAQNRNTFETFERAIKLPYIIGLKNDGKEHEKDPIIEEFIEHLDIRSLSYSEAYEMLD